MACIACISDVMLGPVAMERGRPAGVADAAAGRGDAAAYGPVQFRACELWVALYVRVARQSLIFATSAPRRRGGVEFVPRP